MKIISLNIEGQKHLERVREFLAKENADVVCLQEFFPETREKILDGYPYYFFVPTYKVDQDEKGLMYSANRVWGEVVASRISIISKQVQYMPMEESNYLHLGQITIYQRY